MRCPKVPFGVAASMSAVASSVRPRLLLFAFLSCAYLLGLVLSCTARGLGTLVSSATASVNRTAFLLVLRLRLVFAFVTLFGNVDLLGGGSS